MQDDGAGATYVWRTGTLVILLGIQCDGDCGFDVLRATRAYARAIDQRARKG